MLDRYASIGHLERLTYTQAVVIESHEIERLNIRCLAALWERLDFLVEGMNRFRVFARGSWIGRGYVDNAIVHHYRRSDAIQHCWNLVDRLQRMPDTAAREMAMQLEDRRQQQERRARGILQHHAPDMLKALQKICTAKVDQEERRAIYEGSMLLAQIAEDYDKLKEKTAA